VIRSESTATRRRLQANEKAVNCSQILQNVLIDRMEKQVDSVVQIYETLRIEIQNFTVPFSNSTSRVYLYDVLMEIRSPMKEYDPNRYVEGSLSSQVQKNLFAEELRATDCSEFENAATVDIAVPRTMENKSPDNRKSPISGGFVATIVAGSAAIMILVGVFILIRRRSRNKDESFGTSPIPKPIQESSEYNMAVIDGININTDVSSLGDPVLSERGQGMKSDVEVSTIGSVNIEYDYKKAYGEINSLADSQLMGSSHDSALTNSSIWILGRPIATKWWQ
jgi:hypothetical protein